MPTTKKPTTKRTAARRPAAAPAAPREPDQRELDQAIADDFESTGDWTVNGKPVDKESGRRPAWQHTDQAIALKRLQNDAYDQPSVSVREPLDKAIDARRAAGNGRMESWESPDPMKEQASEHGRPGFTQRYISPRHVANGRGFRGFKPVQADGQNVTLGGLILCEMPNSKAEARNQYYRDQGNDAIREAEEHRIAEQEKAIRNGGHVGVSLLRKNEKLTDHPRHGKGRAVTGLQESRGNSHFPTEAD